MSNSSNYSGQISKNMNSMMFLARSTMNSFKYMILIYKAKFYFTVAVIVSLLVILGYFVFKHMLYRRVRMAQLSYLVRLDPINREFSETVAEAVFVMLRNRKAPEVHLPIYEPRFRENALFYESLGGAANAIDEIASLLSNVKEFSGHDYAQIDPIREDDHISQLVAVVNKRFIWSRAQKLGTTKQCDALFEQLQKLLLTRKSFEQFVENRSMLNFVDRERLQDPASNRTLSDYGAYLDPPLKERVERISKNHENAEAKAKLDAFLNERPELSKTTRPDLKGRLDELFAQLRHEMSNNVPGASSEDMENYYRYLQNKQQLDDGSFTRDYANARYETLDPSLREIYHSVGELYEVYEALEQKRYQDLFGPLYYGMENFMYTTRIVVNGESRNVFSPEKIEHGMGIYQTFLDELYTITNMESIDLATDLILHLMLDPDPRKEEKLDNLGESYVSIVNAFMYLERNLQRLLDYNRSRHPDPKYAMKMYKYNLETLYDFHMKHMILKQWQEFFRMKEPGTYKYTIHWIRNWTNINQLMKLFFDDALTGQIKNVNKLFKLPDMSKIKAPKIELFEEPAPLVEGWKVKKAFKKKTWKKGFKKTIGDGAKGAVKTVGDGVKDAANSVADAAGGFFGPIIKYITKIAKGIADIPSMIGKIVKSIIEIPMTIFNILKGVFKGGFAFFTQFLNIFMSLFQLLLLVPKMIIMAMKNPLKLIELFARLLIVITMLPLVIMYNIPIGKLKMAELFIYPPILLFFTLWNTKLFLLFSALTVVFGMGLDVELCRGRLYPLFYRFFVAVENSPSAWYQIGGYHGKNRNERILLAFRECGHNYVPDPKTAKLTCLRKMEGEPKFCPQANIYRVYKNIGMKAPYKPRQFVPDMQFLDMNSSGRRRQIAKYKKMKLRFYQECDEKMQPYNDLVKNVCRNVDFLEITNTQKKQIKGICYDTYCINGRREQFCHKMTPKHISISEREVPTRYTTRALFLSGSVVFLACVVSLMIQKHSYS